MTPTDYPVKLEEVSDLYFLRERGETARGGRLHTNGKRRLSLHAFLNPRRNFLPKTLWTHASAKPLAHSTAVFAVDDPDSIMKEKKKMGEGKKECAGCERNPCFVWSVLFGFAGNVGWRLKAASFPPPAAGRRGDEHAERWLSRVSGSCHDLEV